MKKLPWALLVLSFPVSAGVALGQADFPAGIEGEVYYAPRIDLVPAGDGGPLTITLDGTLNEPAWERASFHKYNLTGDDPRNLDPADEDNNLIWAAVADSEYLYVAWKIVDDSRVVGEITDSCNVWQDDSAEIYIDALNNGPDCTTGDVSCYGEDDAQITVGLDQLDKAPEELVVGGVAGHGTCDFNQGPVPEVVTGVVSELVQGDIDELFGDGLEGWQAEIAIALDTQGNADDGTPTYQIDSSHGRCIGWNIHTNDDDEDPTPGSDRDHKLIWSTLEVVESSWRNPGVFGKLQFVNPTLPLPTLCPDPVRNVTCGRNADGSVTVAWNNPASLDANIMTDILVDGTSVKKVPGDATTTDLTAAQVPEDMTDHEVTVVNNSGVGIDCTVIGNPIDPLCGAIRFWNILGPYENEGGAMPGVDFMRTDFLTDGTTAETDFEFEPGATIESIAPLDPTPSPRNVDGIPTVFNWEDVDGRVLFPASFRTVLTTTVAYAQVYLTFEEETEAYLGITSDDSIQVFLNGGEVHINDIARGGASPCSPVDTPGPVIFTEGQNSLFVKVFQGIGDWDFSVRLQDELGVPIVEGFTVSLRPSGGPTGQEFVRGDGNADGSINISDGVFVLNFLFTGGPEPPCTDAADTDDTGDLNITDGVAILNWLFLSGRAPLPPSPSTASYPPEDCGADPSVDELTCATFNSCPP